MTPGDARGHHILYFKRLQKVTLKSTLSVRVAYKEKSPVIAQIYIFIYIYNMQIPCYIKSYAASLLFKNKQTCLKTPTLNITNKSAVYRCIGLNTARLQSVCVCVY